MAKSVIVDDAVCDLLGMSQEEIGKLTIDDLTDMLLERGYDLDVSWRHATEGNAGRLRIHLDQPTNT